jgi:hypothetical protein
VRHFLVELNRIKRERLDAEERRRVDDEMGERLLVALENIAKTFAAWAQLQKDKTYGNNPSRGFR